MKKIALVQDWKWRRLGEGEWQSTDLPHDAMIGEPRSLESASGGNAGWYVCHDYEYEKTFVAPSEYADKDVIVEFEGVYRNAEVYLNGEKLAFRPYGYTNFYVDLSEKLKLGEENVLRVIARNADQPNSRWYSGAGIYRPVNLFVGDKKHIEINGLKVRTLSIEPAAVEIAVETKGAGHVRVEVLKDGAVVAAAEGDTEGKTTFSVEVPSAELWSPETPVLYTAKAYFEGDEEAVNFGIRTLSVSAKEGFCINGKRVILRGACIHHEHGILGSRCFPEAEERKVRLLRENGYNAIRSAHNPCSKALLDACDRLGVLVMDEYCDMWYVHKCQYDYATYLNDWWKQDLKDLVDKDYNHPSVVMYSTGNEVGETSEKRGIQLAKDFTDYLHSLDPARYVTCGINIWFNAMYHMGFGQYSDEKAKKQAEAKDSKKKPAVGSEFFNNLAGMVGADFMKTMACLPLCDKVTKDSFANMDIAGYNYGVKRYVGDMKKYPDRIIVGSETFCADAYLFWELAKKSPALIGDFVWAGMDYLGEVGIGSWEYKEYAPSFSLGVGWVAAGSGRVDLIGNPLGEALYTKVAFELEDKPQIAVVPVSHTDDKHSPSAWKFSNAIPTWSWNGLDGKKAKVEVYSRAPVVELYVNGEKVGSKKFKKNCKFDFTTTYRGGEITAVALDENGKELSRNSLRTAGEETKLTVLPEKDHAKMDEVCFVRLKFTDEAGNVKPLERDLIEVTVEGGELLAVGSACPFSELPYTGSTTDTYYGEAMAVVKAKGEVTVTAKTKNYTGTATIFAEEA